MRSYFDSYLERNDYIRYYYFSRNIPQSYSSNVDGFNSRDFGDSNRHFQDWRYAEILDVYASNGLDPGLTFDVTDAQANLIVSSTDRKWISLSSVMSSNYGAEQYYTGSSTPNGTSQTVDEVTHRYDGDLISEYPIQLTPMDLVRFDSGSVNNPTSYFKPENEFTIVEVDTTTTPIRFKIDRDVPSELTGSNNSISRYVFSKRVTDETNIVIQHQKNPGQTSGGIVKNQNLLLSVDDKLANIVSELKSKIFSTVLIS